MGDSDGLQLRGRLIAATPTLSDPNFAHTVVLVLDHGREGAAGLVLNRPSHLPVAEVLPGLARLASEPASVFVGGPVQPEAVLGLGRTGPQAPTGPEGVLKPVLPGVAVVDLADDGESLPPVAAVRLFAGYAGWSGGQLEDEVAAGGWFVVDGGPDDVFSAEPDGLWQRVLRRQGGVFRTVAEDPSMN